MSHPQDRIQKSGGPYADAGSYDAGVYAGVSLPEADTSSTLYDAEGITVKVKEASTSMEAKASPSDGVGAFVRADAGSITLDTGPVKATAGLGVDTGVSAGPDGVEVQVLGTGIRLGPNPKVSVMGSSVECSVV